MTWKERYNGKSFKEKVIDRFIKIDVSNGGMNIHLNHRNGSDGVSITAELLYSAPEEEEALIEMMFKQMWYGIERDFHQRLIEGAHNGIIQSTFATPGEPLRIMHPEDYPTYLLNER